MISLLTSLREKGVITEIKPLEKFPEGKETSLCR